MPPTQPVPPVGAWPGAGQHPYGGQPPYGNQPTPGAPYVPVGHPAYAAYQAQIPGKRGPDGQLLSGWWRRAGGWFIDWIVIGIPATIVAVIAEPILRAGGRPVVDESALLALQERFLAGDSSFTNDDILSVVGPGATTLVAIVLGVLFVLGTVNQAVLVARSGRTVGDRLVGNRKVVAGRTIPTFSTALARWLAKVLFWIIGAFVPLGFLVYALDYLWSLWDPRAQTLHDKMARTFVERADHAGPPVPR
jgi:uncharacterized RDD family membrane protein YckC